MKKTFSITRNSFVLLMLICLSGSAFAQPYNFSHFNAPYVEFTDGIVADQMLICGDDITPSVPIGFSFPYYGWTLDSVHIHATFLIYEEDNGTTANGAQFFPLWVNYNCYFETEVSYKTTGTAGNRIFQVQWKDLGISADSSGQQRVSSQALFYESDGAIEYRFGYVNVGTSAYIDQQPGAFTGLIHYTTFTDPTSMGLIGIADNPTPVFYDENAPVYTMTGTPDSSMVYRFAPAGTSLSESAKATFSVSPNPASNMLKIDAAAGILDGKTIQILTPEGQIALTAKWQSAQQTIDISSLKSGIYFIRTEDSAVQRFVKQ